MSSSYSTIPAEPRCFMHVPKSGGTSIRVALEQALPSGRISPKRHDASLFGGFNEFDRIDPNLRALLAIRDDELAALSDYPVISGHFSLSTLLRVTSASAVATVLREPRARVLSTYAFWRLFPPTARTAWQGALGLDYGSRPVDEFLAEPLVAAATDNLVCRMLLGNDPRIPKVGFIADSDIETVARDAIGQLETLGYVGVLELGDSMWDGFSGFFGVSLPPARLNTTESLSETADAPAAHDLVTLETLDVLGARTAADAVVYRHMLMTAGCSLGYVDRLQATAFAAELVRIGNSIGPSATESRIRGGRLDELTRQLLAKDEELQRATALMKDIGEELAETKEQLRWHRSWLQAVQGSTSWRLTAPIRAGKRAFMSLHRSAARVAR
jgi:hypothetical protein